MKDTNGIVEPILDDGATRTVMECEKCRKLHDKLVQAMLQLEWTAQTVHNAYHNDRSWDLCSKSVCASTVDAIKALDIEYYRHKHLAIGG